MNPKVLVTGHPNSGTSFLCELVVAMGFSPGDPRYLKPADDHNPHGYWEHVPLQNYVRALSGYGDWMHVTGNYPLQPLMFSTEERHRVAFLMEGAGIEVFKETGLPMMWHLFPHGKFIVIHRDRKSIYFSGDYEGRGITFGAFCRAANNYDALVDKMISATKALVVCYEDFDMDFKSQVLGIAEFLGVTPDIPKLREIWRPRGNHAS